MITTLKKVNSAQRLLRITFGLVPVAAGLDKFFNLLADWPAYMSPLALRVLPFSAPTFMHIVGVIEMLVGLAILTKWTRLGSYVAAIWLVAIALELLTTGAHFDVAVRDVLIALAAYSLALLTEVRSKSPQAMPSAALSLSRTA